MVGYKILSKDMTSINGNMAYELNKWYEVNDPIIPHKNGFHFCKNLENALAFAHYLSSVRLFRIESDGLTLKNGNEYVTEKIQLIEEIPISAKIFRLFRNESQLPTP